MDLFYFLMGVGGGGGGGGGVEGNSSKTVFVSLLKKFLL